MKNEEALKILQNNLDFENGKKGIYPCPVEQYKLALAVAIEALKTHDDLCENLAWYINERQRLLKVIEYSKPNEGLQRTIQKALEQPNGECKTCKHFVKNKIDGKKYGCEHPEIQLEHYYDYAFIMMEDNDFCSRYEAKEGENE